MEATDLLRLADEARRNAYAPYSGFRVGAALLTDAGNIYTGCNIENAAYSPGNCAERTAIFKAVSEGERKFSAIAVVGGKENGISEFYPCGMCRQVMAEFCDPDTFLVYVAIPGGYETYRLRELLPHGFYPANLK